MPKVITTATCTAKVAKQTKVYDSKCSGFYVSISPRGTAAFSFKYWHAAENRQASVPIGNYDPATMTVDKARGEAFALKAKVARGEDIGAVAKAAKTAAGVTVGQLIDEYVEYIKTPVRKHGVMLPRVESWKERARLLNSNVRPAIGSRVVADVTKDEIARIQIKIAARSTATARLTRSCMNQIFKFAAEAGRSYITASPCVYLPKLDAETAKQRVLSPEEIRTLWWGLDDPNLPACRSIALALKFMLVTMLRSKEVRAAFRSNLIEFPNEPVLRIDWMHVKKRREILQPLNSLAVEIVREAMRLNDHDVLFYSPRQQGGMLARSALNQSLRNNAGEGYVGILKYLGLKHFTPHDLRRTAATLAGDEEFSDADIARCLDHQKAGGEGAVAPSVTGRVYVRSKRIEEKRKVLNGLDAALRRIIGKRPVSVRNLRLVA